MEVGGKQLSPGEVVFLMIAAANRDPSVYANPNVMDYTRDLNQSITFAPGIHHCVGHMMARMNLDLFFRSFFTRYDKIELPDHLEFTPNYAFRGLTHLPVKLHKA
jgi:cytochrome P450